MTPTPWPWRRAARLATFAFALLVAGLFASAAQPPVEKEDPKPRPGTKKIQVEDEDPKGGAKKKIPVDDPPPGVKPAMPPEPTHPPDEVLDELTRAARAATHPALRDLFTRFSVPFDQFTDSHGVSRIRPIPPNWRSRTGRDGQFNATVLDPPGQSRAVLVKDIRRFEHFEDLAVAAVDQLLKLKTGPDGLPAAAQLDAAEKVLAAVLRFHTYAREHRAQGSPFFIRDGKGWDTVRQALNDRLRDVRLRLLRDATAGGDTDRARDLGSKLLAAYPKDAGVAREVAVARVAEAEGLLKSRKYEDHLKARALLDEFEANFPGVGGDAARVLRKQLYDEAAKLYDLAVQKNNNGDNVAARDATDKAATLDPTVPGLPELRRQLRAGAPTLYVGARQFPELLSPATARLDSERQAVNLVFEGLLEEVPDPEGARYRPAAAANWPVVVPGGRDWVVRSTRGGADGRGAFDAQDVAGTFRLLRGSSDAWQAAYLPWIEDRPEPPGGTAVRIALAHGHPDPRALFTTKLLPARWLTTLNKRPGDIDFAKAPFGTGPYRFHGISDPGAGKPRELVFVPNPQYAGGWRDRVGQPHIDEIRFVELARVPDPVAEIRAGRLHLLPDATPQEVDRILSPGGAGGQVRVVASATSRRVQILALNHREPPFQNRNLRLALTMGIDRDEILKGPVFRTSHPELRRLTAAMTGPFPPGSWATPRVEGGAGRPLVNKGEATAKLRAYLAAPSNRAELALAHPDDPVSAAACALIQAQLQGLLVDPGERKLVINLVPLPVSELLRRVDDQRFDMAYLPFDYPDDWYPYALAAFLDPLAAGRGGRNYLGFRAAGTNPTGEDHQFGQSLEELRLSADFPGKILPRTAEVHAKFNEIVPFVPLWQLDRYTMIHNGVKVYVEDSPEPARLEVINPSVLFHNVARWRLE